MVAARTMDVAVVAFFIGSGSDITDVDIEMERHAGQRMVAVDGHFVTDDLGDDDGLLAKFTLGMQLHSFLKFLTAFDLIGWDDGDILGIVHTVTLLGGKADLEGIPGLLSLHRLFEAWDDLSFALNVG